MKVKVVILIAVLSLMVGIRLRTGGLMRTGVDGMFTAFNDDGTTVVIEVDKLPAFNRWNGAVRLDFCGGTEEAERVMKGLRAEVKWTEKIESMTIYYIQSQFIEQSAVVHGKEISAMIAVMGDKVVLGAPIIKGSY